MKKIAIISNEGKDQDYVLTKKVVEFLTDAKCICFLDHDILTKTKLNFKELDTINILECSFVLVIGGDGTLLNAIASYADLQIPFLGINVGRVGFLADIALAEYQTQLTEVLEDRYSIKERMLVQLKSTDHVFGIALNEVMFRHIRSGGVGSFKVYIDGTLLAHYVGDGVLIAAPTGSTAYALSAGGPIVNPNCEIMIIQPISPHSLNNRSVIVHSNETVEIEFDPKETLVCLDGIEVHTNSYKLSVNKSDKIVKFINLNSYNFYDSLFEKLRQANHIRGGIS